MSSTIEVTSVSRLKARLSEHLRRVKAGETVLITERGRPIGMMTPLPPTILTDELAELAEAGLVRLAAEPLGAAFWERERAADREGLVRSAILEEREEGR